METVDTLVGRTARNWGWILAYGILLIVVGIFAMMNPIVTGLTVGIILSISFLFGGAFSLFAAFKDAGWQAKTVDILFGILALLTSFIFFVNPFGGAISLTWVFGVMLLITGIFELIAAFRAESEKIWLILLGIFDILIGLWATFFMQPGAALIVLATFVGITFIFRGVMLTVIAFKLRNLTKT